MPEPPGHRAGMAILRVETELVDSAPVLIRIVTVDDVNAAEPPPSGEPFASVDAAMAHLRGWLETWVTAT